MFLVLIPFTMFLPFDRKRYFEADTLPHSKLRKKKKKKKKPVDNTASRSLPVTSVEIKTFCYPRNARDTLCSDEHLRNSSNLSTAASCSKKNSAFLDCFLVNEIGIDNYAFERVHFLLFFPQDNHEAVWLMIDK